MGKAFYLAMQTSTPKVTGGLPNSQYKMPCDKSYVTKIHTDRKIIFCGEPAAQPRVAA